MCSGLSLTHTQHIACKLVMTGIIQVRREAINFSYLFPCSYYVGMCGDGANDCGVSRNYFY